MKISGFRGLLAGFIGIGICASAPAHADPGFERAHSLHSLDIMLMVTSLRCRAGEQDFHADYMRFNSTHRETLSRADDHLRDVFKEGGDGADPDRALDRMGVVIANSYGGGHPWLDCAELGTITRELAMARDEEELADAARHLLSAEAPALPAEPQLGLLDVAVPSLVPAKLPFDKTSAQSGL